MPARQVASQNPGSGPRRLRSGTVLAFDYGLRRVGVAVGEAALGIAHPLMVIKGGTGDETWEQVAELVGEWRPCAFVVGMPAHDDGRHHHLAGAVNRFSKQLSRRFGLPVHLIDERFSSSEAASNLREAGVRGRAQKPHLDAFAATAILQAWLDGEEAGA
jgi:putative Holliday junction resolvase